MAECVCGAWLTSDHTMCPQCGRTIELEVTATPRARVSRPSIGDRRLQKLEALNTACAEWGIVPKFRYQHGEPVHYRWRCDLFLAGKTNGAPLSNGQGQSEWEALLSALRKIKNRVLARRWRKEGGLEDDVEPWTPRPKRADHFDNIAYAIWPIEGLDDD